MLIITIFARLFPIIPIHETIEESKSATELTSI
jgi:hypothetical protein